MILSRNNKHIQFVHIPKCGGTSIYNLLYENGWRINEEYKKLCEKHTNFNINIRHLSYAQYKDYYVKFKPALSFVCVRDPLERLRSLCYYVIRQRNISGHYSQIKFDTITEFGMMSFLSSVIKDILIPFGLEYNNNHWLPQSNFIGEQKLIRLENLEHDLLTMLIKNEIVASDACVKRLNSTTLKKVDFDFSLSKDVARFVYYTYGQDFVNLNYTIPHELIRNL